MNVLSHIESLLLQMLAQLAQRAGFLKDNAQYKRFNEKYIVEPHQIRLYGRASRCFQQLLSSDGLISFNYI